MNIENLKNCIGFGVAGNFANHLEQAKEVGDFVGVKTDSENAPKGLFPFYQPKNRDSFLNTFPFSSATIKIPQTEENLQAEPEVALFCKIIYKNNQVADLIPLKFSAYNDCSIRKEGAKKISYKKNWGEASKGVSLDFIEIDKFENGSIMDSFFIASFVKRDGVLYEYGENSPFLGYSYFYKKLLDWIVDKLNTQKDSGPLEDLSEILRLNDFPECALISIGATRYTEFGEKKFLEKNDELFVVLYDAKKYSYENIIDFVKKNELKKENISFLHQVVFDILMDN